MEIYNAKILLGGSRDNEARKTFITAAEVAVLRHIHGQDSVLELAHVGTCKDLKGKQAREILAVAYGAEDNGPGGPKILKDIFGPESAALPTEVEGVEKLKKHHDVSVEQVTRWRAKVDAEDQPAKEPLFAD